MADKVAVLQFMVVRAPTTTDRGRSRRDYIRDELLLNDGRGLDAVDLFSTSSTSEIGKLVYRLVFCSDDLIASVKRPGDPDRTLGLVLQGALSLLERYDPPCPNTVTSGPMRLETVPNRAFASWGGSFYLLPDRLRDIGTPLAAGLPEVSAALQAAAQPGNVFYRA